MEVIKSKKIFLKVRDNIGLPGADEINKITRRLSSVFGFNGKALNPLTFDECEKWLPSIINVEAKDLEFRKSVEEYFTNISVTVSTNESLELEVGMIYPSEEVYQSEKVSYDDKLGTVKGEIKGTPINLPNYILYRFALQHPKVANKKEFVHSSDKIWFYLEDLTKEKEDKERLLLDQTKAREVYFSSVASNKDLQNEIINSCLDFIGIGTKLTEDLTDLEKLSYIEEIITKKPKTFIKLATDSNLPYRSLIHKALYKGILNKMPNTDIILFNNDNGVETLGNGVDETIAFLKHERNNVIKQKIEVKLKALK